MADKKSLPFLMECRVQKTLKLERLHKTSDSWPLEVQVFRLSRDCAIVTLPGNIFSELGLAIKKGSPFPQTIVVQSANENPSYVPTSKAFTEGGYQVVNSYLECGAGEMLVEAAVRMLHELSSPD
jgi:hypothetical protein